MKKILVPCDFSSPAEEAFKFAVSLAKQSKGEINVLHILDITFLRGNPSLSHSYAFNLNFLKDLEKESEEKFRVMWEKHSPLTLKVKFRHTIGSLVPDIEASIRENEIDLVVMGTHGEGSGRWGSNTEKVVRHSKVPVFAIRKAPERAIKKIVVPVIPEQLDKRFHEKLRQLQLFFDASVQLLWINTPQSFKNDTAACHDLQEFARQADLANYSIHVHSDYDVVQGIYRFARDTDADMIAMRTHAWKGLMHFFNGSIAEDVINYVNFPIWTYAHD